MSKQFKWLNLSKKYLFILLKQWFLKEQRAFFTATVVAGGVILIRTLGLLQALELAAFDQYLVWRPRESQDQRIIIIGVEETDLQKYGFPIPDRTLAELLLKISSAQPRAIGLDLYRDLPVEPGSQELAKILASLTNVIGIELIASDKNLGVRPHPILKQADRVGINNTILDIDSKVRRGILFYWNKEGKQYESLAFKIALMYLKEEGIELEVVKNQTSEYLKLGQAQIYPFNDSDGSYVRADDGGYQFLANFRGPSGSFKMVSMSEVLQAKNLDNLFKDRIVLIGPTAASVKDFHLTAFSGNFWQAPSYMSGVEQHANLISHLVNAALDKRSGINVWPDVVENLWIWIWSLIGGSLAWRLRSPKRSFTRIFIVGTTLSLSSYFCLCYGWWLPIIPPLLAMAGSAVAIVSYLAHIEEELKRSKEFLQTIINTIPDPIFVKDKDHRRIVLNQAYCRFIGRQLDELTNKNDYDLFPQEQAQVFWEQDEQVFLTEADLANEEEFTNANGQTYLIATKRSLHKDAAGNVFLVGIIRDITERKLMEEALKQKTAELERYNEQLKVSEDFLRYRAYHDSLTGLPNRQAFNERLQQSLEWAVNNQKMVALLFIDLDGFKPINDTLGHDLGDLLLQGVAERLKGCLRGSDTVCRLAGDEFTVILPGIPSAPDAARVAEKIITTINKPFLLKQNQVGVTMSIGISLYPAHGVDVPTLVKMADMAMYRAKDNGKNRYEFAQ